MQTVDKIIMITMAVTDMPKAKEFYAEKLGLEVTQDYRQDDDNWWVTLTFPEGGATITLSTNHVHMKPGTMNVYFATSDVAAAHEELSGKGIEVSEVQDDLYGPGSGVKFITFDDPEGSKILLVQE
ncbi:MAG TPA: VOC family protein [Candidatus Saccharimonadales bacterium]|nr:VOC family protein [Candidatus Saccharimonadales bacterium]